MVPLSSCQLTEWEFTTMCTAHPCGDIGRSSKSPCFVAIREVGMFTRQFVCLGGRKGGAGYNWITWWRRTKRPHHAFAVQFGHTEGVRGSASAAIFEKKANSCSRISTMSMFCVPQNEPPRFWFRGTKSRPEWDELLGCLRFLCSPFRPFDCKSERNSVFSRMNVIVPIRVQNSPA